MCFIKNDLCCVVLSLYGLVVCSLECDLLVIGNSNVCYLEYKSCMDFLFKKNYMVHTLCINNELIKYVCVFSSLL